MKASAAQYAKTLYELASGKNKSEIDSIAASFAKLLAKNNRLKMAPAIIEKFGNIWNRENGILEAEVESAYPLNDEISGKITKEIKEKYGAKEVILNNKINKDIKGGIIIKIGDEVIDSSVKKQLKMLKQALAS